MSIEKRPYLQWLPNLEPRQLYSQAPAPQYPAYYRGQLYFLEQLPAEGGRCVLVCQREDGSKETITPDGFNLRSRVHEYGGKPFTIANGYVWFSNDSDQRLYKQALPDFSRGSDDVDTAKPTPLTATDSKIMAIDFQLSHDGNHLVFVEERAVSAGENVNMLSYLALQSDLPVCPQVLVSGADFYSNPVISPDGQQLAWVEWNHPQMPWDGSVLKTGRFESTSEAISLKSSSIESLAGGTACSVCQLQYAADGRLFFALDGKDKERGLETESWQLFFHDPQAGGEIKQITDAAGEFGEAHWIFGQQRYVVLDQDTIIANQTIDGRDQLVEIDIHTSQIKDISIEHASSVSQLSVGGEGEVLYAAASFTQTTEIHAYSFIKQQVKQQTVSAGVLNAADISVPEHLSFPTQDGEGAHAWYYPPKNTLYQAPVADLPPMLVMVHGGPTSRCDSALNLQRQYWTGRGFAVLDVNHRGSTGYGRRYRQALQGEWGIIDSQDVADAVNYCIDQKRVHPQQVCIRGGSAGGYVVLRALTLFPELFCAGACYYGIGNLVTLMEFTHKFEARYLDGLLGAPYQGESSDRAGTPYYDRSPIHDLDKLKSPMIVFQGLDDKVVPPALSRELVENLKSRGIDHEYIEYSGEGHGFRGLETRVDALEKEAAFFTRIVSS